MSEFDIFKTTDIDERSLKDITGDLKDPSVNRDAADNGISDYDRFVVKNFFDTQPKKRAAYLKQIGFEMNPKNEEEYRPLGSDAKFQPIEEDNRVLGFIPWYNIFSEEGRKELKKDIYDIGFDVGFEGPVTGMATAEGALAGGKVGAAAGAAAGSLLPGAGTAVGATLGGSIGAITGAGAAGSGSKAMVEGVKAAIGEFLLDKEVPHDIKKTMYQSLTVGALGAGGKALGSFVKNWRSIEAKSLQKTLKNIATRKSNGNFNQNLMDDFAENPQNYTPEAVEGSENKLLGLRDELFGTSQKSPRSTRQLRGGLAKTKIEPLNKRADLEIESLSNNPEANFSYDEIKNVLLDRMDTIINKKFNPSNEAKVIKFVDGELGRMRDKLMRPDGSMEELTFKEGRDILKSFQDATYEEGPVKNSDLMKNISHGLKELADIKAGQVGSQLPSINAKRSEILSLYKDMQLTIKDGVMQNAFVGKSSLSKASVKRMFNRIDEVLDTDLSSRVESGQFQSAVENLYKSPSSFGSGSVLKDMTEMGMKQATSTAFRFGTLGAVGGPAMAGKSAVAGAVLGFAKGAREGARMSSPETLVRSFSKIKSRIDKLEAPETMLQQAMSKTAQIGAQLDNVMGESARQAFEGGLPPEPSPQVPDQSGFNQPLDTSPAPGQPATEDDFSIFNQSGLDEKTKKDLGL